MTYRLPRPDSSSAASYREATIIRLLRAILTAVVLVAATSLALSPLVLAAGSSDVPNYVGAPAPQVATATWGWIVIRKPHASYTPVAADRGNSSGASNQVFHVQAGVYEVYLLGLGNNGGTVLVSPFGAAPNRCEAGQWGSVGPDEVIRVDCYSPNDSPVDSKFVLNFLAASGIGGQLAYVWVDDPGNSNYTPDLDYQYASQGDHVTASWTVGQHALIFPHLGTPKGHVQVTAFDRQGQDAPAVCNVVNWYPGLSRGGAAPDMIAVVWCWDGSGNRVDDPLFEATFMQHLGIKGVGGTRVAYLLADRPMAPSYIPSGNFRYSSSGGAPTVSRSAPGVYSVVLPGMPKGGSAEVTAYGMKARHCVVASIRRSSLPQTIGIRCFDFASHPADAKFTLSYAG